MVMAANAKSFLIILSSSVKSHLSWFPDFRPHVKKLGHKSNHMAELPLPILRTMMFRLATLLGRPNKTGLGEAWEN
jgi:hypothetical protein